MRVRFLILILLVTGSIFGKATYITAEKLPVSKENEAHLQFLKENERYFNHGSPKWEYSVSKAALVNGLKEVFGFYVGQDAANLEVNLVLGDVSSYLYYLNETDYFDSAVKYYKKAIQLASLDYRPFWFLGDFYFAAKDSILAIDYFKMAQLRLPKPEPAEFWEEIARAANQANMPTTCIYAMDKAKEVLGRPSEFERSFGSSVRYKISDVSSLRSYSNRELWSYTEGNVVTFSSRPLGMSVNIEPEWELDISDFNNKRASFTMVPPAVTGTSGQESTFSMSIICKVAADEEDLRAFMNTLITGNQVKNEIEFSNKYPNTISYELVDGTTNKEKGGNHGYFIGVRRKQPLYPGLNLEHTGVPLDIKSGEKESGSSATVKNRFAGTIFYVVKLDACEDIFQAAKAAFWDVFVNQLYLE